MPIRFRCPQCERLLQISRRKAGTETTCPRCSTEVLVPAEYNLHGENGMESATDSVGPPAAIELDKPTFQEASLANTALLSEPSVHVDELNGGIAISRGTMVLLAFLSLGLVALAFTTGLLMSS